MIREEINEIKKQFNKDTNVITKYAGCYVDAEKNIKFMTKDAFYSLPEEDAFKYEEIFRKTLSGAVGKSLLTLDFSIDEEGDDTPHAFLMKLRESRLDDELILDEFFRKVIDAYEYAENYYIMTYRESQVISLQWMMLQMRFITVCFAVSALLHCQSRHSAILQMRVLLQTESEIGL